MRTFKPALRAAALFAVAVLFADASAQTLSIGSADARAGQTVEIPVQFERGERDVVGFQLFVTYDPGVLGAPTCLPRPGVTCAVNHAAGRVGMIYHDWWLQPMQSDTYAVIRFPVATGIRRTTALLGAYDALFSDADARSVPFTMHTGRIAIR